PARWDPATMQLRTANINQDQAYLPADVRAFSDGDVIAMWPIPGANTIAARRAYRVHRRDAGRGPGPPRQRAIPAHALHRAHQPSPRHDGRRPPTAAGPAHRNPDHRRPPAPRRRILLQGHHFDLTDAIIDGGDFSGIHVPAGTILDLSGVTFSGGRVDF
ncbi:hypothetical protein K1W54_05560, partial [Micromonospora sp. CPCC 205371]|nr:hypothetical protein [Micromonospora sp. CPCC 205371]